MMGSLNSMLQLRQLLQDAPADRIDDELLAEIATAEVAGEDVDVLYASEMHQIETSVRLAVVYGELVEMMTTAVSTMNEAVQAVSPREVYLAVLSERAGLSEEQQVIASEVVDMLAVLWVIAGEETAIAQAIAPVSETWRERLGGAIRQTSGALALYVRGQAEAAWQKAYRVTAREHEGDVSLQVGLLLQTVPVLHGEEIGDKRTLFSQHVGEPLPYLMTIRVERETPVTCRLMIQVDRPDLFDVSGQVVQVRYWGKEVTAVTDEGGVAKTTVPIALLPDIVIQCSIK